MTLIGGTGIGNAGAGNTRDGISTRHERILSLLESRGFVSIGSLAKSFAVSEQTVRRDLNDLERRGLVTRYHGGAGLPPVTGDVDYDKRKRRHAQEKRRIAALVASQIPEGATIFIDIGTTMEAVAEALLQHHRLTVVTNHLTVAMTLNRKRDFQVILAGGVLKHNDQATTGEATREFLEKFRVGYGIFGIGGISEDGDLMDYDFRDIGVSSTAMKISRKRLVALDHSKFDSNAMVRVAHLRDIDMVFTDEAPPQRLSRMLSDNKVALFTAQRSAARQDG
ncbi:DeoR/GlpR family DNA-binding transcription regulator [Pelagibius marinus]|uniref:DeoR/GlpR family DNA-binding transcription regulator n=1 Tax=Pelagibius marinus TaxID=2762760 RepID=UPI0018728A88|nr:DeoR/GlpR family DNA-binding transcription regulator [Pelagibius marinus]